MIPYIDTISDEHTDPCVGESAPGCQQDKLRKGAPSWDLQSLAQQVPSGAQVSLGDQSLKVFVR